MKDCTVWGQTSQLVTIDSLKPSDSGNYTCTVTRATVSRSASVIINVIGKSSGTGMCLGIENDNVFFNVQNEIVSTVFFVFICHAEFVNVFTFC